MLSPGDWLEVWILIAVGFFVISISGFAMDCRNDARNKAFDEYFYYKYHVCKPEWIK